jgi:hypothetical protein
MTARRWVEYDTPQQLDTEPVTIAGETLTLWEHAGRAWAALELNQEHGKRYAMAVLRVLHSTAPRRSPIDTDVEERPKTSAAHRERLH